MTMGSSLRSAMKITSSFSASSVLKAPWRSGAIPTPACVRQKASTFAWTPYERADITSNTYNDWLMRQSFFIVPMQNVVGQFLATFKEFPPRQTPSSFSVDEIMRSLKEPKAD